MDPGLRADRLGPVVNRLGVKSLGILLAFCKEHLWRRPMWCGT